MPEPVRPDPASPPDPQIPLSSVAKFLRQLIHDLRNHLNAAELQSAYLSEITESVESKDEIKRLRSTLSQLSSDLQAITKALSEVKLTTMPYSAADFLADLQQRICAAYPDNSPKIEWKIEVGNAQLEIDPQLLLPALTEFFDNALRHQRDGGTISFEAGVEQDRMILTLREAKKQFTGSTENWGREPFRFIGRGHYGLGLHRSRVIVEAHGGHLKAQYDSPASVLITTVELPAGKKS